MCIYINVGLWCGIQTSINENMNNDIEDYTKYGLFKKIFGLMLSYPQYINMPIATYRPIVECFNTAFNWVG